MLCHSTLSRLNCFLCHRHHVARNSLKMAAFTLLLVCFPAMAGNNTFDLPALSNLVKLSEPQLAPDNKRIVVVVSRANLDENRFENTLVLINLKNGARRNLTFDRHTVHRPRWSPDGQSLAFLAKGHEDKQQVFVMSLAGGDAKPVTMAPTGVSVFEWRPDGQDIAYFSEDEPEEKQGWQKHNKAFVAGDNGFLELSASMPSHLWLVNLASGSAEKITRGNTSNAYLFGSEFSWSPDGTHIAYTRQMGPRTGDFNSMAVSLVNVGNGETTTLGAPYSYHPAFSPDGRYIAYSHPVGDKPLFTPAGVYLKSVKGGSEVQLGAKIDRNIQATWMPNGKSMLAVGPDHTTTSAWVLSVDGKVKKLNIGDIEPLAVTIGTGGGIAFVGTGPQAPAELYYMSGTNKKPKQLTSYNASVASLNLGRVETVKWNNDGFEENGVLIYPPNYVSGKKYPLVLNIHGGPMGSSTRSFSGPNQWFAAQGWLVFSPNYRGSNNMGIKYQHAVVNDAGAGPGRDVMAGINALKAMGIVDENRIGVSGWSYGGYMTAWLTAHYDVWAAAMAGAAVTDWFDWYNLADMNIWAGYGLGGSPWLNDNAENYWKQSPVAYAHKSKTPTLIISDTGDQRVTVTQSYKLYHALKDNKVPVKLVLYPVPGHFPADPVHQYDLYERWAAWMKAHFE